MLKRTAAILACLALFFPLAGCGNNDDEKAAKALSDSLMKGNQFKVKKKEADCIGDKMVSKIGVDKLQEYKLLTKDLEIAKLDNIKMSKKDSSSAADSITGCTDAEQMVEKLLTGSVTDATAKKCIADVVDDKIVHTLLAASFSGDSSEATKLLQGPMMECAKKAQG